MKAVVEDGCIACGMCVSICPEVFCMGDECTGTCRRD